MSILLTPFGQVSLFGQTQSSATPGYQLNYQLHIHPQAIEVGLECVTPTPRSALEIPFYTGQIQLRQIRAQLPHFPPPLAMNQRPAWLRIRPAMPRYDRLQLNYQVVLGRLAKHGYQGYQTPEMCVFAGEQVFVIPTDAPVHSISVTFDFPGDWECWLPPIPQPTPATPFVLTITDTSWLGIYQLLKNCYAFGKFDTCVRGGLPCSFPQKAFSTAQRQRLVSGTQDLVNFFNSHFQRQLQPYACLFLPAHTNEVIMGGVGPYSMGFSIQPDSIRDWQLLAHRLFHAYLDRSQPLKQLRLPPWSWLLEGLASFYETFAPAAIAPDVLGTSQYVPEKVLAELFRRYLYFRIKDPELFSLAPMSEAALKYESQREFLHYTQAPLVVYALSQIIPRPQSGNALDFWWRWLQRIDSNDLANFAASLAGTDHANALDLFVTNHLQNSEILPLFDALEPFSENATGETSSSITEQLRDYEALLATWFSDQPGVFLAKSIPEYPLDARIRQATPAGIPIASPELEQKIHQFSPTLYSFLKMHGWRLQVCQLAPNDPERNRKLPEKNNLDLWQRQLKAAVD
ncbi:hypothetical protein L0128_16040 [candidate division KSB1 bacterium]|nr:hypothetical protein [candidate division KSB1 bacterium]